MNDFWFESERLGFRNWTEQDKETFIRMYGDKDVMRYFSKTLSRTEALARVDMFDQNIDMHGFGLWAAVLKKSGECVGVIGLKETTFDAFFTPCAGLTWVLDKKFWRQGLAKEGALRCMEWGFTEKDFTEIYAFTTAKNSPSEAVMKSLGMHFSGTFLHPQIGSLFLRRHVLYKMTKENFLKRKAPR